MSDRENLIQYLYLEALNGATPLERAAVVAYVQLLDEKRKGAELKADGVARAWHEVTSDNEHLYDRLTALAPDLTLAADAIGDYSLGGRTPEAVKELLALRDRLRESATQFAALRDGDTLTERDDDDPAS